MLGIFRRPAQRTLAQLVKERMLAGDDPESPVRIGLPLDAPGILFPNLYPEGEAADTEE